MPHSTLISTAELASRLADTVVLDCRADLANHGWGEDQYRLAHIPGATYVSLTRDLAAPPTGANGRHPLPSTEAMAALFGRLGIESGAQVVVYDQDVGMYASRCWWMLRYVGHEAVAVLDGGWAKWVREARPVKSGEEARSPTPFSASPDPRRRLDVSEVEALAGAASALLMDARAPERYEGRAEPIDRVAGHVPGAVNHFFKSNTTDDGTMLPPKQLREAYTAVLGGRSPADVVVYCGSGVTACHNILAMEHAGLVGARLYPGSWSEWSADPSRPVERGPGKT